MLTECVLYFYFAFLSVIIWTLQSVTSSACSFMLLNPDVFQAHTAIEVDAHSSLSVRIRKPNLKSGPRVFMLREVAFGRPRSREDMFAVSMLASV
jgi:hypothetical protein